MVLDPPVADAGDDITVVTNSPFLFQAKGTDKFGSIVTRQISVAGRPFIALSKQDTTLRAPADSGSARIVVKVTDDDGLSDEDTMVVTVKAPSKSNSDLNALLPSTGALSPGFKPVTIFYSQVVAYADSQVSINATTSDTAATIAINGKPAVSGKASDPVDVKVGTTVDVFKIVVTAQDGSQKVYSVSVTRAPSADATLSKLEAVGFTLKPGFASGVLVYADTVANALASVTLVPTAGHPAAKITVNDTVVVSGASSKALALIVGDNLFKIQVTAQDGSTKSVYNVKVVRKAKLILSQVIGDGKAVVTDSLEFPIGTAVPIKLADSTGFHFLKWTVTEETATVSDSTQNPTTLTLKSATVRARGVFVINTYAINTSFDGFAGGAFLPEKTTIEHGKDTIITVTPLIGYRLFALKDNGTKVETSGTKGELGARTYKLIGVTSNHDLVATFLKVYTITSSATATAPATGIGSISPAETFTVDSGSTFGFTLTSGSPTTGEFVSSLIDNGTDMVGSLTGDPMNISTYTLAGINSNHTISATFAIKTFTLTVNGLNLCVTRVCTVLPCIIRKCVTVETKWVETVKYGEKWRIRSDDSSGTLPFRTWSGGPPTASTNPDTVALTTGNATYTALYGKSIIIPCPIRSCMIFDDPIIKQPIATQPVLVAPSTTQAGPATPSSKEN